LHCSNILTTKTLKSSFKSTLVSLTCEGQYKAQKKYKTNKAMT
jgi:hypothetical protein